MVATLETKNVCIVAGGGSEAATDWPARLLRPRRRGTAGSARARGRCSSTSAATTVAPACGACGCFLLSVVDDGEYVHVAMGSLDDAPSIRPQEHIFVGSKAPWHEITDGLPQHDRYG